MEWKAKIGMKKGDEKQRKNFLIRPNRVKDTSNRASTVTDNKAHFNGIWPVVIE